LTRAVLESKLEEAENEKDEDTPEEKTGDDKDMKVVGENDSVPSE